MNTEISPPTQSVANPPALPQALTEDGSPYLLRGAKLLLAPGYRRFILIPIASNMVLFALTVMVLTSFLSGAMQEYITRLPEWLQVLQAVIWIVVGGLLLFLYSITFTAITNLIAAPFNGLLSEKIQVDKTQKNLPPESLWSITKRTLKREIEKLLYFVGYGIGILLLSFVPLVNLFTPIIGFAWACWVLSVQYIDYTADNNQIGFKTMRKWCGERRWPTLIFGASIFVCTLIPIVNILVMSAAVAGGTLYWLERGGQTASAG
jgi:CysZ protein